MAAILDQWEKHGENCCNAKLRCLHVLSSHFVWFDFCFMALQHILGHFGRGQLP